MPLRFRGPRPLATMYIDRHLAWALQLEEPVRTRAYLAASSHSFKVLEEEGSCRPHVLAAMGVSTKMAHLQQCVVVVDPYSTGGMLAAELLKRNFSVVALWTGEVQETLGSVASTFSSLLQ